MRDQYLDYLKKEMDFMVILGGFSSAIAAFIAGHIALTPELNHLWHKAVYELMSGFGLFMIAAFLFIMQRYKFAFLVRRAIAMELSPSESDIQGLINESNKWLNWWYYNAAFACIFCGILEGVGYALFHEKIFPPLLNLCGNFTAAAHLQTPIVVFIPILIAVILCVWIKEEVLPLADKDPTGEIQSLSSFLDKFQ